MKTCTVEECSRPKYARGFCLRHYRRWAKFGSPTDLRGLKARPSDVPIEEWFWTRVDKRSDGCWIWTAAHHSAGYGQISDGAKIVYAHRMSYELAYGNLDTDVQIDHACRVRDCVNPAHLQAVTRKVNMENVTANKGSASGVRGVHKVRRNRWRAAVGHNGVHYTGGEYATIEEAEQAAIALRNELFTNNLLDQRCYGEMVAARKQHATPKVMRPISRWMDD